MGATRTKTPHIRITIYVRMLLGHGRACDAFFKRFYEWRL